MKIALITSLLCGGGAARVLVGMANHWCKAGHDVVLYSFESEAHASFYPVDKGVKVIFLNIFGESFTLWERVRNNLNRFFVIRKALRAENPDVVISFIDTANIRVLLAMLGSGIPVIVSERIHPAYEPLGRFWKVLRRITYPLADSLVVQTEAVRRHFADWRLGDVRVIPNPVKELPVLGEAPQLQRPSIVAVGRVAKQKNYPLLLRSFARLRCKHPEWNLYIAGKYARDAGIEAVLERHDLRDGVHFLGQVADVGGVLAQADIYVLSSSYEGFPNALCEAMAAGLPCIATDCPGGPADIITSGKNGVLVPNADDEAFSLALGSMAEDDEKRFKLGQRALEIREFFSERRIMHMWEECINMVKDRR